MEKHMAFFTNNKHSSMQSGFAVFCQLHSPTYGKQYMKLNLPILTIGGVVRILVYFHFIFTWLKINEGIDALP